MIVSGSKLAVLGYEIGLALTPLLSKLASGEYENVRNLLKKETIKTPRGDRNFYLDSDYATPVLNVEKIIPKNKSIKKIAVGQRDALNYNHEVFEEIHRENISGWLNPYLCI